MIKDYIWDLKSMCSASNTKSRMFYIMLACAMILLPIAGIAGIVAEVVYIIASNFYPLPIIVSVACFGIWIFLFFKTK